jgi:aminomuconate-semialdehyde/2-hydroxymuconate-6-semialdehyde dehydrogenase
LDQTEIESQEHVKYFWHFIDGDYVESDNGRHFSKLHPCDGKLRAIVAEGGRREVDLAVSAARRALGGDWRRLQLPERCDLLRALADRITHRFDEFVDAEIADTGQPRSFIAGTVIPRGAENFRAFCDLARNIGTESFHTPTPDGAGAVNYALRKPKGVIGIISPWNAPFLLMTWKLAPALAFGNCVVVKPSELSPATATMLGEVMNEVGIPRGVYNVIHGHGPDAAGAFLVEHPGVDAITFTGESATGVSIMKAAADGLRDVAFEMGGKNSAIIFADTDMDRALEGLTRAVFLNCGQICLGTERVLVERPIYDRFVEALRSRAEALRPGPPDDRTTTIGPLISQEHREKVMSYFARARADGATVVTGGGIPDLPEALSDGFWIEPTIWTDLPDNSPVLADEIFGPCCCIQPFDHEAEAIEQANRSPYGLAASVWTSDLARGHRVAAAIDAGVVWVNSWFLRDLRTPFGGMKRSGIGREGGVHSVEFFSELQNICIKL